MGCVQSDACCVLVKSKKKFSMQMDRESLQAIEDELIDELDAEFSELLAEFDDDGNGTLDKNELMKILMDKRNLQIHKADLDREFAEFDVSGDGAIDRIEFRAFSIALECRPSVKQIFSQYASSPRISEAELRNFFVEEQKELPSFYDKFISSGLIDNSKKKSDGSLGFLEFQNLILSSNNVCIHPAELTQFVDSMDQPLADYWINSSHNTYCSGDQLTEPSKVEMYSDSLLRGCRCVELDCWDPDADAHGDEPIIYHGHTLTSKIKFRDVIEAISENAFIVSPFPVILSLEVHCSKPYQKKMASIMKEVFGSQLCTAPPDRKAPLPSPNQLRNKILLKGKPMATPNRDADEDDDDEDSAEERAAFNKTVREREKKEQKAKSQWTVEHTEAQVAGNGNASDILRQSKAKDAHAQTAKGVTKEEKVDEDLSSILWVLGVHKKPFQKIVEDPTSCGMISYTESTARKLIDKDTEGFIEYNKVQMARIYPAGYRVDSSNYNPSPMWNVGCSVVALNYQTNDYPMMLNDAMFMRNARCGYVLKPPELRPNGKGWQAKQKPTRSKLTITIVSAQNLPKELGDKHGEVIDPFVRLKVFGSAGESQVVTVNTGVVKKNGFNPMWNETFTFQISNPDFAFIVFQVYDADFWSAEDYIAHFGCHVHSLRSGYRMVPLLGPGGNIMDTCSLLCHFELQSVDSSYIKIPVDAGLFFDRESESKTEEQLGVSVGDSSWSSLFCSPQPRACC